MKDIKAIIEEHAPGLPDEAKEAILKEVRANYKTVAEYAKKTDRIAELEEQAAKVSERASKLEGDSQELAELKAELKARDEEEAKRKAEQAEAENRSKFEAAFDAALDGKEFANSIVRDSVFAKAYEACAAETGKSAKDAIDELTRDMDGVWVNPQRNPQMMPTLEQVSSAKASREDTAKKTLASMLFGGAAQ